MGVSFIGAGPGDAGLITIKGKRLIEDADTVIYPGSSINPEILEFSDGKKINSWDLSFEEVIACIVEEVSRGRTVVKLHSGDPSLFEGTSVYLRALAERGIRGEIIPGVSSLSAVAASLGTELTKDQTLIVTRPAGEPWRDDYRFESGSIEKLSGYGAATAATMAIFIGSRYIREIMDIVGYPPDTEVSVAYHASWADEEIVTGTVADIADKVEEIGVNRSAMILIKP
ncbi:MAG: S-adenosyl-L-methionine-dependent uroporphyrinogen III methyltransferase [ANME-2 cluster archaeon]|nr:S-adenosyl-L-methionine-dependent uroporphyrinogen III methyltransferase [ANME-2 cluster archaeon]